MPVPPSAAFTGKVDTAGLTEFVTRSFDTEARVWVSDDTYRGQVTRASSMNRYAYVEGAPESFVDHQVFQGRCRVGGSDMHLVEDNLDFSEYQGDAIASYRLPVSVCAAAES